MIAATLRNWVYGWAMLTTCTTVVSVLVARGAIRNHTGEIAPHEQMRERTPWPPPPLPQDSGWVTVAYDKPRREPLALPRGDR